MRGRPSQNNLNEPEKMTELMLALKGNYTASFETNQPTKINLPAAAPETIERKIELPKLLAKLIDEYIAFIITLNGQEYNEATRRNYAGHITNEIFRLAIASDKSFAEHLHNRARENRVSAETVKSETSKSENGRLEESAAI